MLPRDGRGRPFEDQRAIVAVRNRASGNEQERLTQGQTSWIQIPALISKCWGFYPRGRDMPGSGTSAYERAQEIFREHHGPMRTSEALRAGVHPRVLYALRNAGVLMPVSRGLYRLAELPPLGNPDLATVGARAYLRASSASFRPLPITASARRYRMPSMWPCPATRNGRASSTRPCELCGSAALLSPMALRSTRSMTYAYAYTARRRRWLTASSTDIAWD